jgi:hypothetical protein
MTREALLLMQLASYHRPSVEEVDADMHRWEVTLARWSASRGFPSYGRGPHTPTHG